VEQTQSIDNLAARWRARAAELRRWAAAEGAATALERAAEELEHTLRVEGDNLLTVTQAAVLTGRHPDTIGSAIRDGRLTNRGVKHRPRVQKAELVHVFPPSRIAGDGQPSYDPAADARSILGARRGGR
jgi:hypothetical protein